MDKDTSIEVNEGLFNKVDNGPDLPLTINLQLSPSSKKKGKTSPHSPKQPPSKQHANLLNIDPTATLAAISARLATVIPAAETEVARINREALAAMATRSIQVKNQGNSLMAQSHREDNYQQSGLNQTDIWSSTLKGVMTPAFQDSIIAEEWVNLHLETNGAILLPFNDKISASDRPIIEGDDEKFFDSDAFVFRRRGDGGPLGRAGIDRGSLYQMGMSKDLVDRLYRALYVYTNGFHNLINEIASHCPPQFESHVSSNIWLTFLLLLEQCENGKYEIALLKVKEAAQNAQHQLRDKLQQENVLLDSLLRSAESALMIETARAAEKAHLVTKLVTESTEFTAKIAEQQNELAAQAEQIRLLKLEILHHEEEERKLMECYDNVRRDCEVANTGRLNALSERHAINEDVYKLSKHLERTEAEKSNFAKRMRDVLDLNQALQVKTDQLKQTIAGLDMEKETIVAEKQDLQKQIEEAQFENCRLQDLNTQIGEKLATHCQLQSHTEAQLRTMNESFAMEVENSAIFKQEMLRLAAQTEEEKEHVKALEAKCSTLLSEKLNAGMREQDKVQIEWLLERKAELEAVVEANKLDQKRDEEQIETLRVSMEALDTKLQHTKRVFSTGQQAFLHSERTCEQLRSQVQELEKNYVKAKKNVASIKERFKFYETAAKEQITKLEIEVKVTSAQLCETTYMNKDYVARIEQLTHTLSLLKSESMELKSCLEESKAQVVELRTEKEDLHRTQDLATSTFNSNLNRFILALQNMLTLVKLDEFPFDEAIRELLQMIQDTFGKELHLEIVMEDDDKPVAIELDVKEDVSEEEHASRLKRASALFNETIREKSFDNDEEDEESSFPSLHSARVEQTSSTRLEIFRMSRFRKSKLDHLVTKLQSEMVRKSDLVTKLESVVADQTSQVLELTSTARQQTCALEQVECQKGMLQSDLEMSALKLVQVWAEKQALVKILTQAQIDQALSDERFGQVQAALAMLRRTFDVQVIAYEDAMGYMVRYDEYNQRMRSLRRNQEVQATATVMDQPTQTLVPQRNPALERPRVSTYLLPTDDFGSSETLLQKISRATRELLPGVAHDLDLPFSVGKLKASESHQHEQHNAPSQPKSLTQFRAQANQPDSHRRHFKNDWTIASDREHGISKLPPEHVKGISAFPPSQTIYHINEFGTRQNVLVSATQPPIFTEQPQNCSLSPRPPPKNLQSHKLISRNVRTTTPRPGHDLQFKTQDEDRVEYAEETPRQSIHSLYLSRTDQFSPSSNIINARGFDRKFMRAGMEILGTSSLCNNPLPDLDEHEGDEHDCLISEKEPLSDDCEGSKVSSSRLATVVSMYNREKLSLQEREQTQSPRQTKIYSKNDKLQDVRIEIGTGADLEKQNQFAQLSPAVLYPILPNL